MAPTIDQVLSVARAELGRYYPGVSKYGDWYGNKVGAATTYDSAAFCAMGLSWVFSQFQGGLDIFPLHAYTPSGAQWFKNKGQWRNGVAGIRKGDIPYFDFPGAPARVSHVAIVESVNSDGSVNTIEFNTSGTAGGDQRNGRVVARKRRKSYIVGYGRPSYANTPSAGVSVPVVAPKNYWAIGDTGGEVGDIQRRLVEMGYSIGTAGIDLDFGKATKAAVMQFQRDNGLVPDGIVGPATLPVLHAKSYGAEDGPRPAPAKSYRDITPLQRAVGATPDNISGPDTRKRVNAVRRASKWGGRQFPYGVAYAQMVVGTKQDNRWGPNSNAAHDRTVAAIQRAVGVKDDTIWGSATENAVNAAMAAARQG